MQSSKTMRLMAGAMLVAVVPAHAERVGTAGAVNTRSVSTQPGGTERVMEIGAQVVRNERIETSASGSMQIMFIDKTSLTIGPNSKITIDEFVYNPTDGTGTMSVRLGRGLLRVVGGQVTHTGGATITTPAATIGVRGGVATVDHCAGQCDQPGTRATLHFGSLVVTPIGPAGSPTGAPQSITRPGFATFVAGQGQGGQANSASAPQRATQSEVGETNTALNSKRGQAGGATTKPTDQGAGNAGVGTNVPTDAGSIASRQGQNASGVTASAQTPANRAAQNAQQVAQQGTQGAAAQVTAGAVQTSAPSPQPAVALSRTLFGYTGALVKTSRLEQGSYTVASNAAALIAWSPDNKRVGASMFAVSSSGPTRNGFQSTSDRVSNFKFGSAPVITSLGNPDENGIYDLANISGTPNPNADPKRSHYIDDRRFGGRAEVETDPVSGSRTKTSTFLTIRPIEGGLVTVSDPTAFATVRSKFGSSDDSGANTSAFLSRYSTTTVQPCDCEYTRWGFWSATARGNDPTPFSLSIPLSTWVAGVPTQKVDMPVTGNATYVGHAIATISNGGNSYLATGNFSNTVNFGLRTGAVQISNLDRTNYAGTVNILPGSTQFQGTLTAQAGGLGTGGSLNGMFYQNSVSKVGEMGGGLSVYGPGSYIGAGTFAAKATTGLAPVLAH